VKLISARPRHELLCLAACVAGVELIGISDRILIEAGSLLPAELRSVDLIHLATMRQLGASLRRLVTYGGRLDDAAALLGIATVAPA